jgi:hypothetical protein
MNRRPSARLNAEGIRRPGSKTVTPELLNFLRPFHERRPVVEN